MPRKHARKRPDLLIVGAGGHARVVAEAAQASGWRVLGVIDASQSPGTPINGLTVLGGDELWQNSGALDEVAFVVAIGEQMTRRCISTEIIDKGGRLATVVHPRAIVSPSAELGCGTIVNANAVINANATIGKFCIINSAAVIEHDCVLNDGVQISPRAVLCGNVHCDDDVNIGAGATLIPGVFIGARTIIGAGSVMTKDVAEDVTVVGVPGRVI